MGAAQRDKHATETAGKLWKLVDQDKGKHPDLAEQLRGCQFKLHDLAAAFRAGDIDLATFDAEVALVKQSHANLILHKVHGASTPGDRHSVGRSASGEDEEGAFPQAEGAPALSPEAKALLRDTRFELDQLEGQVRGHTLGGPEQQRRLAERLGQAQMALSQLEAQHLDGPQAHLPADLDAKGVRVAQAKLYQEINLQMHSVKTMLKDIQSDVKRYGPGSDMKNWN